MLTNATIIYLLLQIFTITTEVKFEIGCCTYEMDPFRGFTIKDCKETSVETLILYKDQIGYEIIELCEKQFSGIPANDNFQRLKNDKKILSKEECLKDCEDLVQQLNESYAIIQENNRIKEAKKLRILKKSLQGELNTQIGRYSKNLSSGNNCKLSGSKNINIQFGQEFPSSVNNRGADNVIKNKVEESGFEQKNQIIEEKANDLSPFPSLSVETKEEKLFRGLPLSEKIELLDLEIMYFEKKNKRPLSFILDRFNIKDEILVKLIKVFELSLEEVVINYKTSMKENIFFQLKLFNKYEIKKNKKI